MSHFLILQWVLTGIAASLIAWQMRRLLSRAALDARVFARVMRSELVCGRVGAAQRLARSLQPAAGALLASAVLDELVQGRDARCTLEEAHAELHRGLSRGRDEILALGRIASPLALIGVILELAPAVSLMRGGAVQRMALWSEALTHATQAFALGFSTLLVCSAAAAWIERRARELARDLDRIAEVFDGLEREAPCVERAVM